MRVRCPHCRNPIEIVEDQSLAEIDCPTCGSSFNLIAGDETATYTVGQTRTIAHFELIQQIGAGRFGSVWKARDT